MLYHACQNMCMTSPLIQICIFVVYTVVYNSIFSKTCTLKPIFNSLCFRPLSERMRMPGKTRKDHSHCFCNVYIHTVHSIRFLYPWKAFAKMCRIQKSQWIPVSHNAMWSTWPLQTIPVVTFNFSLTHQTRHTHN